MPPPAAPRPPLLEAGRRSAGGPAQARAATLRGGRHRGDRRRTRQLGLAWAGAMVTAMIAFAGLAPAQAGHDPALAPGQVRDLGAELYLQNCASCHGPQGEGAAAGPSLVGVGAASADFYLRTGRMPLGAPDQRPIRQEPAFDDAEIEALVARIEALGPGPAIPQVREGGDVNRGWSLYQANCAACHGASGAGNAVGGGAAAYGLAHSTDVQIAEAMLIGPGVMPRFDFPTEDRDAIVAYVEFLQSAPSPGGAAIGGFGPVSEGFIAVILGLVFVVIAVKLVGRSTGEADRAPETSDDTAGGPAT